MKAIPTYALYGEYDTGGQHWLHWETITSRSRLHGFRIDVHRHDHLYQILHLTRGVAHVVLDGEAVDLSPPRLVIVPPLTVHSFVFSPDVEGVVLTFFARDVGAALDVIGADVGLSRPVILKPLDGVVEAAELEGLVRDLIAEADRSAPGQDAALRARLSLLLVAAHRLDLAARRDMQEGGDTAGRHARTFLALVDRHYRDTRRIGFYAEKVGITPTHLNRVCRDVFGTSALAVIEKRIVLEAQRYLQFTTLSVKEIGIVLGYPDPAYFSRFFARSAGQKAQAVRDGFRA